MSLSGEDIYVSSIIIIFKGAQDAFHTGACSWNLPLSLGHFSYCGQAFTPPFPGTFPEQVQAPGLPSPVVLWHCSP